MNKYLEKGFLIIEKDSKQLSILPNDVKLIIHVIDQIETDFIMAKKTAISSVADTIKKFYIKSNLRFFCQKDL